MIEAFILKLWKWYKGHDGVSDAHHTKYTDAEADARVDLKLDDGTSAGQMAFWNGTKWVKTETSEMFWDDTNKRLGVGTTSPDKVLDVSGTGSVYAQIETTTDHDAGMLFRGDFGMWAMKGTKANEWVLRDVSQGSNRMTIDTNGNMGINTTSPTEKLDINSDAIRIRSSQTPATAGAAGNQGDICWDSNYMYVCTATNTWKRTALSTW